MLWLSMLEHAARATVCQFSRRNFRRSFLIFSLSDKAQVLLHHWSDWCRCCGGVHAHATGKSCFARVYQWLARDRSKFAIRLVVGDGERQLLAKSGCGNLPGDVRKTSTSRSDYLASARISRTACVAGRQGQVASDTCSWR